MRGQNVYFPNLRLERVVIRGEVRAVHHRRLLTEGTKLRAEGDKLREEGNKLRAEGDKLRAEGDKLWAEAIIKEYGNIKLEWKNWNEDKRAWECHLENGEIYIP